MGTFRIEGGHQLHGEITPQGAKNEALQILTVRKILLNKQRKLQNKINYIMV